MNQGDANQAAANLRFHPSAPDTRTKLHTERLYELIGGEHSLSDVERTLRHYVQSLGMPVVGALQLGCSDEAEQECIDAFTRNFVRYLLPSLKLSSKAAFRVANLGGRYEWGAIATAESHFAMAHGADKGLAMVIKVNSHVSVGESDKAGERRFGYNSRYDGECPCCGALHATLEGADLPFVAEIEDAFSFEGIDRLADLCDEGAVQPELRSLYLAIVHARLQARRALLDIQDEASTHPTVYLVLACVTLNRAGHDTEFVVGLYAADRRDGELHSEYCGLGDDPRAYSLKQNSPLVIEDYSSRNARVARDHRSLVLESWGSSERRPHRKNERLDSALEEARRMRDEFATDAQEGEPDADKKTAKQYGKVVLQSLVPLLAELAPIPVAAILFGSGVLKIHHAARAHRLLDEARGDEEARAMLSEVHKALEKMDPEHANHVVELMLDEYQH